MRLARFAPLALVALPLAATGQGSDDPSALTVQPVSQPRPGQYRTALELIAFEAPGAGAQAPALREAFAEELATGNEFCLKPGSAEQARMRRMVLLVAEGECTFARFDTTGATVSAALSCRHDRGLGGPVTVEGRVWPENSDLELTMAPTLDTIGEVRIRVRARAARINDC